MCARHFCVYGVRKIWRQLTREVIVTARCTVARLMRKMGLAGVVRSRSECTTISDPAAACPFDRVNRQFEAPRPNALWVSDFTYVATWSGFVYMASSSMCSPGASSTGGPHVMLMQASFKLLWSGLARAPFGPGQRAGAPLRTWLVLLGSMVHRAPGRSRHRAVGRQRRRLVQQRPGQDDQRPVQGGGDPPAWSVALFRVGGVRQPGVGRLVQTTATSSRSSETSLPPRPKCAIMLTSATKPWPPDP